MTHSRQGPIDNAGTTNATENATATSGKAHYKPPFEFGIGRVPLGNEFSVVTDEDAYAIQDAA